MRAALVVVAVGAVACGPAPTPAAPPAAAAPAAAAPATAAPATAAPAPAPTPSTPPPAPPRHALDLEIRGGSSTTPRLTARVVGLRACYPLGYEEGRRYIGVEIEIENHAATPIVISSTEALIIDGAGRRFARQRFSGEGLYTPRNECWPDLEPGPVVGAVRRPLAPGEKQRGFVHDFPLAPGAQGLRLQLETFTEAEWKGPAFEARPELFEVRIGELQPIP